MREYFRSLDDKNNVNILYNTYTFLVTFLSQKACVRSFVQRNAMGSRIRPNPDKLFEVFVEIARPQEEGEDPFILQKYPPDYDEQDALVSIPKFAFPCKNNTSQVDQFAFVFTDLESMYRFGYCRHGANAQTCLCIVSHLPWFEVFFKMLNFLAEIINRSENSDLIPFLKAAYEQTIPVADEPVTIVAVQDMFNFTAPDPTVLPSIPASRNLTEYYNAVETGNMMRIFASMLHERRIIITSKKLSRVTACVHASESLLYPMHWQHLFIPVLPSHLIDYVTAPMPYLIGIHTSLMEVILKKKMEIGDAVIVDADKNEVASEYDDLEALPEDVSSYLKRHLKTQKVQTSMLDSGDAISRAFLQALVRLIGGYRDALKFRPDEPITFDREAFVQSRSSQSMQAFLESMLQLQIFQQFINERLELLNGGKGFHDLFEHESIKYSDSLNSQSKYKEWLSKQKRKIKAGGKDIISDMKEKAAPMMTTAVHTMKVQSKKLQSRLKEINDNKMSSRKVSGGIVHSRSSGSDRQRPSTISGSRLSTSRPPRPPPPVLSSDRPRTMLIAGQKTDRSRFYNTLTVEEEASSHDDSQLRLSYHRVDVNLMTDIDIQNAMMRSASAETLPHPDIGALQNASDGDISSTPSSSEALSPSDENLSSIPYVDMGSAHPQAPFTPGTSSSDEDLTKPPALPTRESRPPLLHNRPSDRLIVGDRLITGARSSASLPRAPPRPPRKAEGQGSKASPDQSPRTVVKPPVPLPRRASLESRAAPGKDEATLPPPPTTAVAHQKAPEKSLINFESSESELDSVEFDPLATRSVAGGDESFTDFDSSFRGSPNLSRNKSSRNSLMRSEAFRRAQGTTPVRTGCRDDDSLLERDDKVKASAEDDLAGLFDPLAGLGKSPSTAASSVASPPISANTTATSAGSKNQSAGGGGGVGAESDSFASLMQDWTLDTLSSSAGTGFQRVPSGGKLVCSTPPPPAPTQAVQQAPHRQPGAPLMGQVASSTSPCPPQLGGGGMASSHPFLMGGGVAGGGGFSQLQSSSPLRQPQPSGPPPRPTSSPRLTPTPQFGAKKADPLDSLDSLISLDLSANSSGSSMSSPSKPQPPSASLAGGGGNSVGGKISPVSRPVGGSGCGMTPGSQFSSPRGVALDSGGVLSAPFVSAPAKSPAPVARKWETFD